ncbi:MAG: DMT family transporter [Bacteroidota bacterium]
MNNSSTQTLYMAHGALLAVALIYALNYFIAKFVMDGFIGPFGMVAIRSIFATSFFILVSKLWIKEKIQSRADYYRLALCGLFGSALNQLLFFKGLSMTVEINASVLMITSPVFVFIIASLLRTEHITPIKIVGLIVSFGGALMLILGGRSLSFGSETLAGDLMVVMNASAYGVYLVLVKPLMHKYHPMTIVKWVFIFGAIIIIPVGTPELLEVDWANLSQDSILGAGYIVLFTTISAYSLNAFALKQVSPSAVGIYIYLQPVLVAILSVFWAANDLTLEKVLYMLVVFSGVFLVTYRKKTLQTTSDKRG